MSKYMKKVKPIAVLLLASFAWGLIGCNEMKQKDIESFEEPNVQVYFNAPGTREGTQRNLAPLDMLIERIDGAKESIDIAVYGFEKKRLAEALIRAYDRGVDVRMVGDSGHLAGNAIGYQMIDERRIPMQVGNRASIMHSKFIIIDDRYVFAGTGNFTPTGFTRNNNNWIFIDSVPVAQDFGAEFNEFFEGRYSNHKERNINGNRYKVGDTIVEPYYSPNEDITERIMMELRDVDTSVHFQIFAFTKDLIGSKFIDLNEKLQAKNEQLAEAGELPDDWKNSMSPREWPNKVVGLLDRSQVHGNGQFHESYRLQAFGVPMRVESNENSVTPGDYQAGGGRLHTKTMILDAGTEDARVITGSFNWSASAQNSNDEFITILRGERIAQRYMEMFNSMWLKSRTVSGAFCYYQKKPKSTCSDEVDEGDVVISEVHWDGWNGLRDPNDHTGDTLDQRDRIANDEFIELYNTTDEPINLSMWTITNGEDFKVGFPPGTVIEPNEYYLILDHNQEFFSENDPQRGQHAFQNANFVLNLPNDPRFHTLDIKNASFFLDLRDGTGQIIDEAGNGGPPFYGGRVESEDQRGVVTGNYSMERVGVESGSVPDGTEADSWQACQNDTGNENVNEEFRDVIIATPGAANSSQ